MVADASQANVLLLELLRAEQPLKLFKNLHLNGPEGLKEQSIVHSATGTREPAELAGEKLSPLPLPLPFAFWAAGL